MAYSFWQWRFTKRVFFTFFTFSVRAKIYFAGTVVCFNESQFVVCISLIATQTSWGELVKLFNLNAFKRLWRKELEISCFQCLFQVRGLQLKCPMLRKLWSIWLCWKSNCCHAYFFIFEKWRTNYASQRLKNLVRGSAKT